LDALEFHHKDPGKKDFGVGKYSGGWEKIRQEIEKCDLLCANCHREAHAEAREKEIEQARKELGPKRVRKPNLYVPCGNCGSTVVVFPSRAGRSKRHFCSRDCFLKSQTGRQSAS
jgi:ribosomal protein S27E